MAIYYQIQYTILHFWCLDLLEIFNTTSKGGCFFLNGPVSIFFLRKTLNILFTKFEFVAFFAFVSDFSDFNKLK